MDREKVINGLREMSCRATWKDIDRIRDKFQPIINDAINLLKEQEYKDKMYHALEEDWKALLKEQEPQPVKVVKNVYNHEFYYCPKCDRSFHELLFVKPKFCDKCGQAVEWE